MAKLQFQSRLHSKGGRSIALTLAKFNVPIMALNATTQILVPPPKPRSTAQIGHEPGAVT